MRSSFAVCTAQLLAPTRQVNGEVARNDTYFEAPPARGPSALRLPHLRSALRVDGRCVRTAVWTLAHPATGRTVTLVGTMHIGDAGYFHRLSEVLERLAQEGTEVHVEGISHGAHEDLSDWERDRLAEADSWGNAETSGSAVAMLGLDSQGRKLRLPDNTRNIDMTYIQLLRRVGWDSYRRLLAPQPEAQALPGTSRLVRIAIRFQLRHSRALARLASLRPGNRGADRVVMGARNQIAFAGAIEALGRNDVALVWGTDHLPALAELFGGVGYRPQREEWFDACSI